MTRGTASPICAPETFSKALRPDRGTEAFVLRSRPSGSLTSRYELTQIALAVKRTVTPSRRRRPLTALPSLSAGFLNSTQNDTVSFASTVAASSTSRLQSPCDHEPDDTSRELLVSSLMSRESSSPVKMPHNPVAFRRIPLLNDVFEVKLM